MSSPLLGNLFSKCTGLQCGFHNNPKTDAVLIAEREFRLASDEEKDFVFKDIYGTYLGIEETEEMIDQKLLELDVTINQLSFKLRKAYLLALKQEQEQNTHYIKSRKFRLMFLRSEKFDVKKSALRLVKFCKEKLSLFGESMLPRPITQADLNGNDIKVLYSGGLYISKDGIDDGGRVVVVCRTQNIAYDDIINFKRARFYWITSTSENNEDAQRRGIVLISYSVGKIQYMGSTQANLRCVMTYLAKLWLSVVPLRIAVLHICYDDFKLHLLASTFVYASGHEVKARYQLHFGNDQKCMSELQVYGIHVDNLPIDTINGEYKMNLLHLVLQKELIREQQEEEQNQERVQSASGRNNRCRSYSSYCDETSTTASEDSMNQ